MESLATTAFEAKRGPGRGRLVALPVPGPRLGEGGPDNIVAGGAVCLTVSLDIVSLVCREPPRARVGLFLPSWVAVGDSEHYMHMHMCMHMCMCM